MKTEICHEIQACRISGSTNLQPVLNLGNMALTGVFPATPNEHVPSGPVELVWCPDSELLQMRHSYNPALLYGDNYGYRSGLNASMVKHLQEKVAYLQAIRPLDAESAVLDIGGNDGTLLKAYSVEGLRRVCVDPTAEKWLEHYVGTDIVVIPDFWPPQKQVWPLTPNKFDIITSIAMFYDLEDPRAFVERIREHLSDDGIWHFEQSYLPAMVNATAYDTVCHEHIEYYNLTVIKNLLESCKMRLLDVQLNDVNGGSFAVTACHAKSKLRTNYVSIDGLLLREDRVNWTAGFINFAHRVQMHRNQLFQLVSELNRAGKVVAALGASTKGNVLLQYCGFTNKDIQFVSDVNPLKHGCFTPGTNIPIVSEELARAYKPDYMLVLPWHFREGIISREKEFLRSGGRLIFPLPKLVIV